MNRMISKKETASLKEENRIISTLEPVKESSSIFSEGTSLVAVNGATESMMACPSVRGC